MADEMQEQRVLIEKGLAQLFKAGEEFKRQDFGAGRGMDAYEVHNSIVALRSLSKDNTLRVDLEKRYSPSDTDYYLGVFRIQDQVASGFR